MSYLDRSRACHSWRPQNYRPFALEGEAPPLGWVTHGFAARLRDFAEVFIVRDDAVLLASRHRDFDARSAALREVLRVLYEAGEIPKWRGEDYGISRRWGGPPLFKMERGAVPLLGVLAFGVHVNGYVESPDGPIFLWSAPTEDGRKCSLIQTDAEAATGQLACDGVADPALKVGTFATTERPSVWIVHARVSDKTITSVEVEVDGAPDVVLPVVSGYAFGTVPRSGRIVAFVGENAQGEGVVTQR